MFLKNYIIKKIKYKFNIDLYINLSIIIIIGINIRGFIVLI